LSLRLAVLTLVGVACLFSASAQQTPVIVPSGAVVVMGAPRAIPWLNSVGLEAVTVSEQSLSSALAAQPPLVVLNVADVRQFTTVDAMKAYTSAGGKIVAVGWGPAGFKRPLDAALSSLLGVQVTGWSPKGNAVIAATHGSLPARLTLSRGSAFVATPRPSGNGGQQLPTYFVVGRWLREDDKPPRNTPKDAAVIRGPSTLWIGEDIFCDENNRPETARWFTLAAVSIAPVIKPVIRSNVSTALDARLSRTGAQIALASSYGNGPDLADARNLVNAGRRALMSANLNPDFAGFLTSADIAEESCLNASARLTSSPPVEIRAARIPYESLPTSRAEAKSLIAGLSEARFNCVLPEVVARGSSAFPSSVFKRDPRFAAFDPLRALVDEGRLAGVQVHAWIWTLCAGVDGDQGRLLRAHPEWAAQDRAGRVMSDTGWRSWVSPSIPEARTAVRNGIREMLSQHNIDGVVLDYAGYESTNYDYCDAARAGFRKSAGVDPWTITSVHGSYARWREWLEHQLDSLISEIRDDVRAVKPLASVGVRVFGSPEAARRDHMQNWSRWAANRWVDWVIPQPMNEPSATELTASVFPSALAVDALIAVGAETAHLSDLDRFTAQMESARTNGATGLVLMNYADLSPAIKRILRAGAYRNSAVPPWLDSVGASRSLAVTAAERLNSIRHPDATIAATARNAVDAFRAYSGLSSLQRLADEAPVAFLNDPALGDSRYASVRAMMNSARRIASARMAVTGSIPASRPPVPAVSHPEDLPSAKVPLVTFPPIIDGRLNRPAWTNAVVIPLERTLSGEKASLGTEVRLMRDGSSLQIGFTCRGVLESDSISVILSPSTRGLPYYRFIVNKNGFTRDDRTGDDGWIGRWSSAVEVSGDTWEVALSIPLSGLITVPGEVTSWSANFARIAGSVDSSTAVWAVPYGPFTTPDRLGTLTF
jgi:hypothetical protein